MRVIYAVFLRRQIEHSTSFFTYYYLKGSF